MEAHDDEASESYRSGKLCSRIPPWGKFVAEIEVVSKPVLTYFSLLKLENDCTAQPEKAATQRYSRALVVPLHPAWPVLMRG